MSAQLVNLFRMDIKAPALNKAEKEGRIPTARRKKRGKINARYWLTNDLPQIGRQFGVLKQPNGTLVIAVYVPKGGTGKTFWSVNFARILALHDIKTLVIGGDFQCNLSKTFGISYDADELPFSLYDAIIDKVDIKDIIRETDIPTLDFIPESPELTLLDRTMIGEFQRETILSNILEEIKSDYQAIIIDCPPQWNELVTNSLMAADAIVSPVSADGESYHSFKMFVPALTKFIQKCKKEFRAIKFIPNNVDVRNKYTTSFQKKFLDNYPEIFTTTFIRESVTIKESGSENMSVLEYDPKSFASDDIYNCTVEIWNELTSEEQ